MTGAAGAGQELLRGAIEEVLANHRRWVETGGAEGRRAVLRDLPLAGQSLREADLRYANLEGAELEGADLSGADLQWANIKRANLQRCNLPYTKLINADLSGAQMRHACLDEACLIDAQLSDADLQYVRARKASFLGASMLRVDLRSADLEGAYLTTADVRFAQLGGASLRQAQLRNTHLGGTDLHEADLAGADLRGAHQVANYRLRQAKHWRKTQRDGSLVRRLGEGITGSIAAASVAAWQGVRGAVAGVGNGLSWIGLTVARAARATGRAAVAALLAAARALMWLARWTGAAASFVARGLARAILAVLKAPVLAAVWLGARTAAATRFMAPRLARAALVAGKAPVVAAVWLGSRTVAAARFIAPGLAIAALAAVKAPVMTAVWLISWTGVGVLLLLRGLARATTATARATTFLAPRVGHGIEALVRGLWHGLRSGRDRARARRSDGHAALAMRGPSRALAHGAAADSRADDPVWRRVPTAPSAAWERVGQAVASVVGATAASAAAAWTPRRPTTLACVGAALAMAASVAVLSLGQSPSQPRAQSPAGVADGTERLLPRKAALQEPQQVAARRGGRQAPDAVEAEAKPQSAPEDRPQVETADGLKVRTMQDEFVALENSNVRAGPSTRTKRVGYLSQGTRVDVTGEVLRKRWYRVSLPDAKVGYVYMPLLKQTGDAGDRLAEARDKPVPRPVGEAR